MDTLAQQWPLLAALVALVTPILMFISRLYERMIDDLKERIVKAEAERDRFLNMALLANTQADTAVNLGEQATTLRRVARR